MTAHDDAVERLARALWLAYDNGECWEMYPEHVKDDWRKVARIALREHPAVEALILASNRLDQAAAGKPYAEAEIWRTWARDARTILAAIKENADAQR